MSFLASMIGYLVLAVVIMQGAASRTGLLARCLGAILPGQLLIVYTQAPHPLKRVDLAWLFILFGFPLVGSAFWLDYARRMGFSRSQKIGGGILAGIIGFFLMGLLAYVVIIHGFSHEA